MSCLWNEAVQENIKFVFHDIIVVLLVFNHQYNTCSQGQVVQTDTVILDTGRCSVNLQVDEAYVRHVQQQYATVMGFNSAQGPAPHQQTAYQVKTCQKGVDVSHTCSH
jgi:hypothetical protein